MSSTAQVLQDKDFLAAPIEDKIGYLSHVDPDFAQASKDDQTKYIEHLVAPPPSQPTQFEQQNTPAQGSAISRLASGAWSGLKSMLPSSGTPESTFDAATAGMGPIPRMAKNAVQTYERERESGEGVIPSVGSAIGSSIGLDTQGIKERANRGDVAGVIGEGIPSVAATVLGGESARRIPETGEAGNFVASKMREPATARQSQLGRPGSVSALPTSLQKWTIPDWLIPKGEKGTPTNPGPFNEIPTKIKPGSQIPSVGSAAQESGYYPSVTKVPIRPEPPYRLTPESVPGPDTAGKGNLLSPLAKAGDPRAAQELMRRGRRVLYVPAEEYGPPRERIPMVGDE